MSKTTLIVASTRQNRIGGSIAEWLKRQADETDIELNVIDLQEVNLPAFDAPIPPAYAPNDSEHGKAWAKQISESDSFIFLTPEYNRSIPSSLKNAIDYLVPEWKAKKAAIVSYGYVDGGANAAKHLTDVLNWLKMDVSPEQTHIKLSQDFFDKAGAFENIDESLAEYSQPVTAAVRAL